MSKIKTRLIVIIAAIVTIVSTFCYAETDSNQYNNIDENSSNIITEDVLEENEENPVDTINEDASDEIEENNQNIQQEVHEGDLYLFDSKVTMDKLVDGNVFIFGNDVTITGQCSGSMFVFGNNIVFDKAYVQSSIFVCGKDVKFDAVSTSLYCASDKLDISNHFGVYSDLHALCSNLNFDGIVGRDAFLSLSSLTLGDNATFYGDVNYSSSKELDIPSDKVDGNINYTKISEKEAPTIKTYISNLIQILVLVIITFFIVKLFTKEPHSKECSCLSELLKTFGIGLLAIIAIFIAILFLMFTLIGFTTSMVCLLIYIAMFTISKLIFSISLARYICIGKSSSGIKSFLFTLLITFVLWLINFIPFIGGLCNAIATILGFGIIIYTPLRKKMHCSNKHNVKIENTKDESPTKDSERSDNISKEDKKLDDK